MQRITIARFELQYFSTLQPGELHILSK